MLQCEDVCVLSVLMYTQLWTRSEVIATKSLNIVYLMLWFSDKRPLVW